MNITRTTTSGLNLAASLGWSGQPRRQDPSRPGQDATSGHGFRSMVETVAFAPARSTRQAAADQDPTPVDQVARRHLTMPQEVYLRSLHQTPLHTIHLDPTTLGRTGSQLDLQA